jgi:hypothetical protein
MNNVAPASPAHLPRTERRKCRYRVVQTMPTRFAVIERLSGDVVAAGFETYEAGWSWIANKLDGRHE